MITGREIGERFIRAVQIMEGLYRVGPGGGGSSWIAIPYTQADKNGWGAERLAAERKAFWNSINNAPRPWEITEAEEALGWLVHVTDEEERVCLMNWAECMATEGIFKVWCKARGIHVETGRRRKERAILRILLALSRKTLQHNDNAAFDLLRDPPEMSDKDVNIGEEGATHFRTPDAKPMACNFDTDLNGFDWANKQNARRREREARKRQAA